MTDSSGLLLIPKGKWLTSQSVTRVFDVLMPEHKWFKQSSKSRDPNFLNVLLYIGGIEQSTHHEAFEDEFGIRISPLGMAILVALLAALLGVLLATVFVAVVHGTRLGAS